MESKNLTVKEFINELKKLDPDKKIEFSAVGEIACDISKDQILEYFDEEKNSKGEEVYSFVL